MFRFFSFRAGRADGQRGGFSLTWILFQSVFLVMAMVFIAVQTLGLFPDANGPLALEDRLGSQNLYREAVTHAWLIVLWVGMMMAGVLVALRLGLGPLRRISERASDIGPATISQRLPLNSTPREIAPLVVAFNAALDRLEDGMRAQREFSANAAHELRTPLATLRAQVESILDAEDRRDATEQFDRLGRLIAQLLALAEADNGEDLGRVTFDLVALSRDLVREMAGAIVASDHNIAFETVHSRWDCHGVPGLVEVAIRNLLENAMRHTPAGCEILVSIDDAGRVRVSDDGPGVPPEFHARLFQRFSKAAVHGFGAGLGLSIVERVMVLHKGAAYLEQVPTGCCFVLELSTSRDATHAASSPSSAAQGWPLRPVSGAAT